MATEHLPENISAKDLCEITRLTDRYHRDLAVQGHYPPPKEGVYNLKATLSGFINHLNALIRKKTDSSKQAETRLKNAKADMAEEELAAFREQYVLKSEIGPALRNLAARQRDALQFKLEQEIAPNLSGKKPVEILQTMQAATDSICLIFENGIGPWLNDAQEK